MVKILEYMKLFQVRGNITDCLTLSLEYHTQRLVFILIVNHWKNNLSKESYKR